MSVLVDMVGCNVISSIIPYLETQERQRSMEADSGSIDAQLFDAARDCEVEELTALLDAHPDKLEVRNSPYEWTLLHTAAQSGCLAAVDLLLARGLDPNTKEAGDRTYAMHWAAAAGQVDIVQRLIDAGGDVIGRGDDHELEVIGWASCWEGCDDQAHRDVVSLLLAKGAQHHIFSAIAMNLGDEVRRVVARDPSSINRRLSRNEDHQTPLHFAVRFDRPAMVPVLLELGADPTLRDSTHDSDVLGWAEFCGRDEIVRLLKADQRRGAL